MSLTVVNDIYTPVPGAIRKPALMETDISMQMPEVLQGETIDGWYAFRLATGVSSSVLKAGAIKVCKENVQTMSGNGELAESLVEGKVPDSAAKPWALHNSITRHDDLTRHFAVFLPSVPKGSTQASKTYVPTPVRHYLDVSGKMHAWGSYTGAEFRTKKTCSTNAKRRKVDTNASGEAEGGAPLVEEVEETETTHIEGDHDCESDGEIQEDEPWLRIHLVKPGMHHENVLPFANFMLPITPDANFITSTMFRRVDVGHGMERKLTGRSPEFEIVYESVLKRTEWYSEKTQTTNTNIYVGARVDKDLYLFPTENYNLRCYVPADEEKLLGITTDISAAERAERYSEFVESFGAAKRQRKLRNAKNKEVNDDRVEGGLVEIKDVLSQAANDQDRQKEAMGSPHVINAMRYVPAWSEKIMGEKCPADTFRKGLEIAFPERMVQSRITLDRNSSGKTNPLVNMLWDSKNNKVNSVTADGDIKALLKCDIAFDLIRMRRLKKETKIESKEDAEYTARLCAVLVALVAMHKDKKFSFTGSKDFVRKKFKIIGDDGNRWNKDGEKETIDPNTVFTFTIENAFVDHLISTFYTATQVADTMVDSNEYEMKTEQFQLNKNKLLIHTFIWCMYLSPNYSMNYATLESDLGIQDKHHIRDFFEYAQCEIAPFPGTTVTLPKKFEPLEAAKEKGKGKKGSRRSSGKAAGGGGKKGKKGKGKGQKGGGTNGFGGLGDAPS